MNGAPAKVQALIELLTTRSVRLNLGWRAISDRYSCSLLDTFDSLDDPDDPDGRAKALASSFQLGASAGGEVYFGIYWQDGEVKGAEIDFEEETIAWFESVGALFDHILNEETQKQGPTEALRALFAAADRPLPESEPEPKVITGLSPWAGSALPHPAEHANSHFGSDRYTFDFGSTPQGRTVLAQRFNAGLKMPARLAIRDATGAVTDLVWADQDDIYGGCLIPGTERALLCLGAPGPLIELDLNTGDKHELLPKTAWSCGFVDTRHVAVWVDRTIQIRPMGAALGEPVAEVATTAFNMFVAHGCVFHKQPGKPTTFAVHRWTGDALVDEGKHPVEAKIFFLNASSTVGDQKLVGTVDTNGAVHWFTYG